MNHLVILITFACLPHARPLSKRLIIVSNSTASQNLYAQIRHTKPFQNEPNIDYNTRKQICFDVTSSNFFHASGVSPYERPGGTFATRFVGRPKWMYTAKAVQVWLPIQRMTLDEWIFECLARKKDRHHKYYISEEYNLDADDNIPGRFVFHNLYGEGKSFFGLAEAPAKVHFHPDYAIEDIYLQHRAKYKIAWKVGLDSLCGLSDEDRVRVCEAALWFKYVVKKHSVHKAKKTKAVCEIQSVSFQTERGRAAAEVRKFREWMLMCAIDGVQETKDVENDAHTILSQTYRSNQVIMHKRHDGVSGHIYPETLLTNIRLVFDPKNHGRPAADEAVAEDYQKDTPNNTLIPRYYAYSTSFVRS